MSSVEPDRDRHRREGLVDRAIGRLDRGDGRLEAAGQRPHEVAGLEHAGRDRAGVAAVVEDLLALRPDHVLDREADVDQVAVARDVQLLEVAEQRRAVVPGRVLGARDDVVAQQGRDRDEGHVADAQPGRELLELDPDLVEPRLREVDEVHLVDADRSRWGTPSSVARNACRRLCSVMPLRASSRISATSAVEAPVTMLRVYWMCPGVSAMMNLRRGVAK